MSKLFKRGNKVYIDFTDQWNIRHRQSIGLNLLPGGQFPPEAKQIKKSIDAKIAYGTFDTVAKTPSITISQLKEEFINFVGSSRDKKTKYLYKLATEELIKFTKDVPIVSITQETILSFRDKLLKKSESHTSRTLRSLSPMFRFAAEEKRWIPYTPITRYTAVKVKKKHIETYTNAELDALFNWAKVKYPHFYNQVKFLYLTGFRSNESCTIQWKHIDFDRGSLIHYDDKLDEWVTYPIDLSLKNHLSSVPRESAEYVFHYRSIHSLDKIMIIAREKIPLRKDMKIHTLKANYIRDLIDAGVPELDGHKLSHHKSIATTHRYYATFNLNKLKKSLAKSRRKTA